MEATRVGKQNCVVAAWAYHIIYCTDENITAILHHFYYEIIQPYWDKERRFVDERYTTVTFNFSPLPTKDFDFTITWTKEQLLGYFASWSAVQNYVKQHQASPLTLLEKELTTRWPTNDPKEFHLPLFLKLGRITK